MRKVDLYIGNKIYSGWTSLAIERDIETLAGAFSLEVTDNIGQSGIEAGKACYVEIDGHRAITGHIDEINLDISSDMQTITVTGRDKTADLIDCAAIYQTGRWSNVTLEQIARDLCAPFDINVVWSVNDEAANTAFKWWQIEPSETVFETLARAARQRGILMTSNVYGDLVFCTAGTKNIGTLTLGENIKSLQMTQSHSDRYSLYRILGNNAAGAVWGETQTSQQSTSVIVDTLDSAITRYRPTVILCDDNLVQATGQMRGDWAKRRAIAHSQVATVTVCDWFCGAQLWLPNHQVTLNTTIQKNTELLITKTRMDLTNNSGMTTTLTLMPRTGFLAPAEIDPYYDYIWRT